MVAHILAAACAVSIGYTPDPAGLPPEAVGKVQLVLNWVSWGSIIAAAAIALGGIGWAKVAERIGHSGGASAGRAAFYVALGKVAGVALLPAAMIWVYSIIRGMNLGCT